MMFHFDKLEFGVPVAVRFVFRSFAFPPNLKASWPLHNDAGLNGSGTALKLHDGDIIVAVGRTNPDGFIAYRVLCRHGLLWLACASDSFQVRKYLKFEAL